MSSQKVSAHSSPCLQSALTAHLPFSSLSSSIAEQETRKQKIRIKKRLTLFIRVLC